MTDAIRAHAQSGLEMISEAIVDYVAAQPDGARNDEVARALGLSSSFNGGQRNYLTHAILNRLSETGTLARKKRGSRIYYVHTKWSYALNCT